MMKKLNEPMWVAYFKGEEVSRGLSLAETRGLAVMDGYPVDELVYRCERPMPEE